MALTGPFLLQRPPCQGLRPQARFEANRRKAAALRPRWLAPPQAVTGGFRISLTAKARPRVKICEWIFPRNKNTGIFPRLVLI